MCDGEIDFDFVPLSVSDVSRFAAVPEGRLGKWLREGTVGPYHDGRTVVEACAAQALEAAGVDRAYLQQFTTLISEHLMFHLLRSRPRLIIRRKRSERGKLVRAPRHQGLAPYDFAESMEHEPYRYVMLCEGCSIWLSNRRHSRHPGGAIPDSLLDMREIGRCIAARVDKSLIVSVFVPLPQQPRSDAAD